VEMALLKMPYRNKCIPITGRFPDTATVIPINERFAFHLDADLYMPMYEGLNYFFPRVNKDGYILIHDYDKLLAGMHNAVDRFISKNAISFVPVSDSGGSCVIVQQ